MGLRAMAASRLSSGVRRRTAAWATLVVLLLAASAATWHLWLAPTRVALVHYPDFQAARIVQARPGPFVRVDALGVDDLDRLRGYDLVLLFGRGLALSEQQLAQLRAASAAGTPLYVDAPTNPRMDLTNLAGDDLDAVSGYLRNGGPANYAHLLNYARAVLDGKALFSQAPRSPEEMPKDVFFGLDDRAVFTDYDAFQAWQRQQPGWQAGRPRLALLTSVPGPFNANRDHVDATIRAFESAGFDVVPISAIEKRLEMLRAVDPAAVVYMPHGRLTPGQADAARQWLAARNIPLFAPVTIFEEESTWAADPRSFDGGLLAMSVTLPELDGAIAPVAIAAQARDERGFKVFRALPHRLDRFASLVRRTVALRSMPNKDKKLAVYYYKGPGQSALHAGNLEVVPSLYAFLKHLKTQGYRIDGLPDTEQGFADLLQRRGPNIGPYAKGAFAEFTRTADPALVSAEALRQWCGSSLDQSLCDQAARQFGPAPGDYLRVGDQVAVARVPLGNVVLLPQPLPGLGEDTFKLVHGTQQPPPWPYIASYLWTRTVFKADAILHFGTHGSLEFTPYKQVGLSDRDWPDALIGDMPHVYLYTMSNVGEAMIAKRRSYATIISHLTPPFSESGAQSPHRKLADQLQAWDQAASPALKTEYARDVQRETVMLGLHRDLGLDEKTPWTDAQLQRVAEHMETLEHGTITMGLYTLGTPYADADLRASAGLMGRDHPPAIPGYRQSLAGSPAREFAALDTALSGGYVQPSSGGDPIVNPAALPTGRNLYSIDAEKTPSEQAWRIGRRLADQMLTRYRDDHGGAWPEKVALTLWAGDFIQNEGVGFAQILSLLGVEPVRDPFGRVSGLRLMPRETLGRPRIDVVVQTSGQLRDLAASRLYLVNRAVAMAAAAREDDNAVAAGVGKVERALKERGLSPADARRYASLRVFGGVNGNYGTHIMGMVEAGDRWQNDTEVAQTYLNNMGAVYGEGDLWGAFRPGVFEAALTGTDLVIQPLQSNTWGPISLDHVYEFMGGLNLAVRQATGKDPAAYFSDLRNPARPTMREAGEAIALEARSTLLNPAYIQAMTRGGASSAEVFAETFRNVYGWNVMKPAAIAPQLWDALYDTYVRDTGASGLQDFFERTNPYALQEMTAVMLETARKGYWKPDAQVLRDTARLHADLVARHGASGTGFVNDNAALRAFIAERLDKDVLPRYEDALQQANEGGVIDTANGLVLRKQEDPTAARPSAGQPGAEPVQEPARQSEPEAVSPAYRYAAPVGALLALLAALAGVILWIRRRHAAQEFHA
jgi:cobalamin biosynthesis Mg chelatase CobN